MYEFIKSISLGRFSRANVKMAPSAKIRTKANNIFATYRKLNPDPTTVFVGYVAFKLTALGICAKVGLVCSFFLRPA
uniref:Uncharacterized protein LOC105132457 isoform X13 n=1 Tax=Rhizophora mucronata TaxID=61149 RepID=A0A2P2K4M1_RHIMU